MPLSKMKQALTWGLLLGHLLGSGFSFAGKTARNLPDPEVIKITSGSAENFLESMSLSHPAPELLSDTLELHENVNLNDEEYSLIKDFIKSKGRFKDLVVPPNQRKIVLVRYHVDIEEIADLLIEAKEAGFSEVQLITDLNYSIVPKISGKQLFDAHPTPSKVNQNSDAGRVVKKLLEAGFGFNNSKYGISGSPVFRKDDPDLITPIMHEKELLLIANEGGENQQIFTAFGTSNMSKGPRYNRLFTTSDETFGLKVLEHARNLQTTFGKEETIENIPESLPQRLQFPDGTIVETAFNDGKFNPNDRIVKLLERSVSDSKNIEIQEVVFSHFVFTHMNTFNAHKAAMKHNPNMKTFAIFDEKFVQPYSWGVSASYGGFFTQRPFGPSAFPPPKADMKNMEAYVYTRGIPGIKDVNPSGPPVARNLWHDKTTLVSTIENGKKWTYVFTGSFNLSGAHRNAEMQVMLKLPSSSKWVKAIKESIKGVKNSEKAFLMPIKNGAFRSWLAWYLNRSALDIPPIESNQIMREFHEGKIDRALERMAALSSHDSSETSRRLAALKGYADWSMANLNKSPEFKLKGVLATRVAAIGEALLSESEGRKKSLLGFAVWSPKLSESDKSKRMTSAGKSIASAIASVASPASVAEGSCVDNLRTLAGP